MLAEFQDCFNHLLCSSNKTAQNATSLGNNSTNANNTNSIAETINNTLARNENIHEITQRLLAGKGVSKLSRPYVGGKIASTSLY